MANRFSLSRIIQRLTIRQKLLLIVNVSTITVLVLMTLTFFAWELISFRQSVQHDRQSIAKILGRNTLAAIDFNDAKSAKETLNGVAADPHILSVWLLLPDGELFAAYVRPGKTGDGLLHVVESGGKKTVSADALDERLPGLNVLSGSIKTITPIYEKGVLVSTIIIFSAAEELVSQLKGYLLLVAIVFIGGFFASQLIVYLLQRIVTAPLSVLVDTMEQVAYSRDYSLRVKPTSEDEIGILANCFNLMLEEIAAHDEQLLRYQDKLGELVAARTAELLEIKESAETLPPLPAARLPGSGTVAAVVPARGRVDLPQMQFERSKLFALMGSVEEEVWFRDYADGAILANAAVIRALGQEDIFFDLDPEAGTQGLEIYRFPENSLPAQAHLLLPDFYGAVVRQREVSLRTVDGRKLFHYLNATPVKSPEGDIVGSVVVLSDITMQKDAEAKMRDLSKKLIDAEELLRRKIAAELHDEVGRGLTGVHLNFELINGALPADLRQRLEARIDNIHDLLEELSGKVANIITELRPPMLDDFGLETALKWLTGKLARYDNLVVELLVDDNLPRLEFEKETAIFRIAQEAINNAVKHAEAHHVIVGFGEVGDCLRLMIADDGKGFSPGNIRVSDARQHWGLTLMRERAESIGGSFTLESAPGSGTTIFVDVRRS